MTDAALTQQIRRARGKFAAMAAAYGFGVFNDSFYRQGAMMLALAAMRDHYQGWIMAVFTLPYILFASYSGWMADRFSKRHVVVGAKALELVAMVLGGIGIITLNWPLIIAMAFVMGWQSCIFSPSLNGSIPELYPDAYVTKANAVLRVVVMPMILAGIAFAGLALDVKSFGFGNIPGGRLAVGLGVMLISVVGLACSLGAPTRAAAAPTAPFPWTGPWATLKECARIYKDRLLRNIVIANVHMWFVGSLLIQLINKLGMSQLTDDNKAIASALVAVEVVGLAAGGVIGSRLAAGERWYRQLPFAAAAMGLLLVCMLLVPTVPEGGALPLAFVLLTLVGISGGMVIIPAEGFVQRRPPADEKGRVIAAVNFAVFSGIFVSGPVANALLALFQPSAGLAAVGALTVAVAAWLYLALRKESRP